MTWWHFPGAPCSPHAAPLLQTYPVKSSGSTNLLLQWLQRSNKHFGATYIGKRLSFLVLGPSLAGSSDILMASSIAAKRPLPPSPLRAGPKHSGLRMRRRTTTLAFSSTLSPIANERMSFIKGQINGMQQNEILHQNKDQTIDKHSKSKKVKIFLSTTGIPSNIRVTFGQ